MRPEKGIGARVGRLLLVLAAAVVLSGFVGSDVPQNRPQATSPQNPQQSEPLDGLPSNPQKWVCKDSTPTTQEEIDAWCASHTDRGLPLPVELRNPPPVSEFAKYVDYSNSLKTFLTGEQYKSLNWISDAHWRFSGPSVNPPGGDFGHNYGPHFPLRVYYSPSC